MNNKYYDGSERESTDKKAKSTKKSRGRTIVDATGSLLGLLSLIVGGKKAYDQWKKPS